jgi:hypothetical protein
MEKGVRSLRSRLPPRTNLIERGGTCNRDSADGPEDIDDADDEAGGSWSD